jgi:hypothetical protein
MRAGDAVSLTCGVDVSLVSSHRTHRVERVAAATLLTSCGIHLPTFCFCPSIGEPICTECVEAEERRESAPDRT